MLGLAVLTGCSSSPYLSKEEAQRIADNINDSRNPLKAVRNVVAIINNDVYYFNRLDTVPRRLTNSATQEKTDVKLSSDRKKVAYLNEGGHPVIISATDGKVIETLWQYTHIDQMGWVRNTSTLYMLVNNKVEWYGERIDIEQPVTNYSKDAVLSFSMNSLDEHGYFIEAYGGNDRLIYQSAAGKIDDGLGFSEGGSYNYIDFFDNKGGFMLGNRNGFGGTFDRVGCRTGYDDYNYFMWREGSMRSPTFNASIEVLVYGGWDGTNYFVKAVYLGTDAYANTGLSDILQETLTNYTSNTAVSVDWVQ
ncbi:hypothetical protein [Chryseolinea lacunae]|uniref:Uncharacterized protein n=1 Tax=Chryseolinea lacunae TaxID=2801331 RepID=A0ABS1KYW4_9BACT|nr:hypothetical protein [Chryseolinea lacunae]MBL0744452.1 hypothetical protein [Chryseolinea lacunae]